MVGTTPLCHIVADGEIAVGRTPVLSETGGSLPESTIAVGQLAFAADQGCRHESIAIKSVLGGDLEFPARGQRTIILEARRRSVIGNDANQPLAFGRLHLPPQ